MPKDDGSISDTEYDVDDVPSSSSRSGLTSPAEVHDSMMNPSIEVLADRAGSRFTLVSLAAARARQINSFYGQTPGAVGRQVPPQVSPRGHKPLSVAFEEIAAGKIVAQKIVAYESDASAEASSGDTGDE